MNRDEVACVDVSVIAELKQLDGTGEVLAALIAHFLHDTPYRLAAMQAACHRGDAAALADAAHALKGASGNVGAVRLQQLSGELQTIGRANALDQVGDRLARLGAEFSMARAALLLQQARFLPVRTANRAS